MRTSILLLRAGHVGQKKILSGPTSVARRAIMGEFWPILWWMPTPAPAQLNTAGAARSRGAIRHSHIGLLSLLLFLTRKFKFALQPVIPTSSQLGRWAPTGARAPTVPAFITEARRRGDICPDGGVPIRKFLIHNCSEIR